MKRRVTMTQSPFQQNIDIVKGFFRKPIILVTAILALLSFVLDATAGSQRVMNSIPLDKLFNNTSNAFISTPNINLLSLLTAVAFLLFYLMSRNEKSQLKAPAVMFKVSAIIQLVAISIGLAALIVCAVAFSFVLQPSDAALSIPLTAFTTSLLLIVVLIVGAFVLTLAISQLRYANSIRKSLTSVYISAKGATLFGIMNIIGIAIEVVTYTINLPTMLSATALPMSMLQICSFVISVAAGIMFSVVAIKYGSYIKNLTGRFVTEPQQPVTEEPSAEQPVQNVQTVPIQQYIPGIPSPSEVPQAPTAQSQQTIICKNCGEQLGPDDYFCNNCGTPIER